MKYSEAINILLDLNDYEKRPYVREALEKAMTCVNMVMISESGKIDLSPAPAPVTPVAGEGCKGNIALGECCECEMSCCPNHEDKEGV